MVVELTTKKDKPPAETEVLFSIDGVAYEIPKRFGANVALQLARITLTRGPDQAVAWALETALGPVGMGALMAHEDLEMGHLEAITAVVLRKIAAGMELPKGGLKAV